jgi:DNA topoisomerase 2-associated protein PAT1
MSESLGLPAANIWGLSLDFEDTYDGLGDQLDETDDVFNDDTFGGDEPVAESKKPIGKDFDFFGQTAKVSGAINDYYKFLSTAPSLLSASPYPPPTPV